MKINFILMLGILCILVGCAQEQLLFHPVKLQSDYSFQFQVPYAEYNISVGENISLNSVLLKSRHSKGVILYLHGNGGNISYCHPSVEVYLKNNYDVFMVDYRGFGKSNGQLNNEAILYADMQKVYNFISSMYPEEKIILLGYSIGTGLAAQLASINHPKALLLLTPYYSLPDVVQSHVPFISKSWVKFKIPTYQFLASIKIPVYIFHGQNDIIIDPDSSTRLQSYIHSYHQLYILENQGHHNIEENAVFQKTLKKILDSLK